MKLAHRILATCALAAACIDLPMASQAQVERSGGGELQKIMQQYQQVAAEKTALQTQLAQSKKDLDAANAELAAVKKERDAARAHVGVSPTALAAATSAKESAERSLEKAKAEIAEVVGKYRELVANLRGVEADRTKLTKDLAERNAAFDRCAVDNVELYRINGDLLDRYDHVGLFTKTSAAEPFTRLTRTRIDNLVVEYKERADQLRVKAPQP